MLNKFTSLITLLSVCAALAAAKIFVPNIDNRALSSSLLEGEKYSLLGVGLPTHMEADNIPSVAIANKDAYRMHRQMVEKSLAMLVTAIGNKQ